LGEGRCGPARNPTVSAGPSAPVHARAEGERLPQLAIAASAAHARALRKTPAQSSTARPAHLAFDASTAEI
jgi:hypothetical protein